MKTETLTLVKGKDRFIVSYEVGLELEVLNELTEQAKSHRAGFDWFDAAIMSHQLGKNLAKECKASANP